MNEPLVELDIVYHLPPSQSAVDWPLDPRIRDAAQWIARRFDLQKLYASIAVVDDDTIQDVNSQQLGHAWPTDVISFVLDEGERSVEGEVIASAQTALRVSAAAGWSAADELLLYIVHGLLHVVGLDDVEMEERQAMRLMERDCLLAVGVKHADEHLGRWDAIYNSEVDE